RWLALRAALEGLAARVASAEGLAAQREPFEPLSRELLGLVAAFGNPTDAPLRVAHCPMAPAEGGQGGARWLQRGDVVSNAYFGDAMLTCGSVEATLAPGARWTGGP
ncbi:MAG: hypothetical protein AAGH15_18925, partial [Myxococcota bacterium]